MVEPTHLDAAGHAHMVDVGQKPASRRRAKAEVWVELGAAALGKLLDASLEKGDAFCVARIAGIQGAKGASALIPLCHSLILEQVSVDLEPFPSEGRVRVLCEARATGPTGVEMEALCGAGMAALTLYDMCKGMNRGIRIDGLRLLEKEGGRSGLYRAEDARAEDAGSAPEQQ